MRVKCKSPVVASNGLKVETGARKKLNFFKINIHYGACAKYMFFLLRSGVHLMYHNYS